MGIKILFTIHSYCVTVLREFEKKKKKIVHNVALPECVCMKLHYCTTADLLRSYKISRMKAEGKRVDVIEIYCVCDFANIILRMIENYFGLLNNFS